MEIKEIFPAFYMHLDENTIINTTTTRNLSAIDYRDHLKTIENQLKKMTTL